jgi:hypothetical protein
MKFQVGYTLSVGGESKTEILWVVSEEEYEKEKRAVEVANRIERRPGLHGRTLPHPATYFIRPVETT